MTFKLSLEDFLLLDRHAAQTRRTLSDLCRGRLEPLLRKLRPPAP